MWTTPTFSTPFVSDDEFKLFHTIDRKLYTLLVINLWRDPVECMQVMALWLWLERKGFGEFVKNILPLPYTLAYHIAEEAVTCLNCINNEQFNFLSEIADIPMTQTLAKKDISLNFFVENRLIVAQGIMEVRNDVCVRALSDIMQQALDRNLNVKIEQSLARHGFPHVGFGLSANDVPQDNRTLFVTFSKGYPVFEGEIREFFTRRYGSCIEYVSMPDLRPSEQSLFARIVFDSAAIVESVLTGVEKAKFIINGKHVWARRYLPKQRLLVPPPSSSVTPPPPLSVAPPLPLSVAPPPPSVTPLPPSSVKPPPSSSVKPPPPSSRTPSVD